MTAWFRCFLLALVISLPARAQITNVVYTDSLQSGWENWSWATVNLVNTTPFHSGTRSISVTISEAWSAIYLHNGAVGSGNYSNLTFWINGGPVGGQRLTLQATAGNNPQTAVSLPRLPTNAWQQITVSLAALGVAGNSAFDGFWLQDATGSTQPTFYVDDIALTGSGSPVASATIVVNVASNRHAISDLIYGVAFADSNQLKELNAPLNRSGGNTQTRYNWQQNAANRANDWYFQSLSEGSATAGAAADDHVQHSKAGSAEAMMTVPMIGWLAKLGPGRARLASYSIAKYGPQTSNDWEWFPDAGNGISSTNGRPITWNDPNDANVLTDSLFQQSWIQHLTNRWGTSQGSGIRYYCMDNEISLWHSTHRDVHPTGATMQELRDKFFDYATKVKQADPGAILAGPEEWGWSGYFYSGYDQQWSAANNNFNPANFPDRKTNGGWDYLPWFLDQCRQRDTSTGQRLLDIFTVHYYPQGGEFSDDVSSGMQARRNRSTRSLWDTNYTDESWIGTRVQLIPRVKQWVSTYYPGTRIGLTEYNWGAERHMNGATAQADVLGILGREGMDVATRWTTPATNTPTFKAMKMFRNYDNAKSTFGDTSVHALAANPDQVAAFAAQRSSDQALTIMLINKTTSARTSSVLLTNFPHNGLVQRWVLETNAITRRTDVTISNNVIECDLPAQSVTLLVATAATRPQLRVGAGLNSNTFSAVLQAPAGRYVIEASTNLNGTNWSPVLTNNTSTNVTPLLLPAGGAHRFYRATIAP